MERLDRGSKRFRAPAQLASRLASVTGAAPSWPITFTFIASGPLQAAVMHDVITQLAKRHDALRMAVPEGALDWALIRDADDVQVPFEVITENDEESARRRMRDDWQRGIDTRNGPLIRMLVIRIAASTHLLSIMIDHIGFDGLSGQIFFSELASAYRARASGDPAWREAAGPVPQPYAEFGEEQLKLLEGPWGEESRGFWCGQFERFGPYPPRGGLQGPGSARPVPSDPDLSALRKIALPIGEDVLSEIRGLARLARATPYSAWIAALLRGLQDLGHQASGVVIDVHGRIVRDYASTVGLFSHGAPVYARLGPAAGIADVREVAAGTAAAVTRSLPLRGLSAQWRAAQGMPHEAVPYVYFSDETSWRFDYDLGDVSLSVDRVTDIRTPYPTSPDILSVRVERHDGQLYATAQFDSRVNDPELVGRLLGQLADLSALRRLSRPPDLESKEPAAGCT